MKLPHPKNLVFVGTRNGIATVQWGGVAIGYCIFVVALVAASLLGWYSLAVLSGADFTRGLASCFAVSTCGAAAVVTTVVTGSLRRPLSDLPSLD